MSMMKVYLNGDAYEELLFMVKEFAEIEEGVIKEQLIEEGEDPEEVYDAPSEIFRGCDREFEDYLESLPGGNQVYEIEDYLVEGVLEILREGTCEEGKDWYIVDSMTEAVTKDK